MNVFYDSSKAEFEIHVSFTDLSLNPDLQCLLPILYKPFISEILSIVRSELNLAKKNLSETEKK